MCIGCTIEKHWLPAITEALDKPIKGSAGPNSHEEAAHLKKIAANWHVSVMSVAKMRFFEKHGGKPKHPAEQRFPTADVRRFWKQVVEKVETD